MRIANFLFFAQRFIYFLHYLYLSTCLFRCTRTFANICSLFAWAVWCTRNVDSLLQFFMNYRRSLKFFLLSTHEKLFRLFVDNGLCQIYHFKALLFALMQTRNGKYIFSISSEIILKIVVGWHHLLKSQFMNNFVFLCISLIWINVSRSQILTL